MSENWNIESTKWCFLRKPHWGTTSDVFVMLQKKLERQIELKFIFILQEMHEIARSCDALSATDRMQANNNNRYMC